LEPAGAVFILSQQTKPTVSEHQRQNGEPSTDIKNQDDGVKSIENNNFYVIDNYSQ